MCSILNMDFNQYGIHKIEFNSHMPSVTSHPTAVVTNTYQSAIDNKNDLQYLPFHNIIHENPDSPPPAVGEKNSQGFVPELIYHNLNKSSNASLTVQNNLENTNDSQKIDGNRNASSNEECHLCQYCNRVYPSRTNLSRHIFRVHRIPSKKKTSDSPNDDCKGAICYEKGCDNKKFKCTTDLRNHLVNEHNFIFQIVRNQLETEQQFVTWKKTVEETCNIKWVKQAAKKKASGNTVITYICHRSGKFRSNGVKRRALKSCKIGHFCTAYLKVIMFEKPNENGKKYSVELYPDHYGHDVSSSEEKKVKIQVAKCLTNPVRGILIGTSGVLFENGKYEAIKGSVIAIEKLRKLGIVIRFLTNDSQRTPTDLVKKLQSLGFTVFEEEIISPIPTAINTLTTLGLRPYLIVHPDIRSAFDNLDQSSPNCVVIGDFGNNFTVDMFNKAFQVLISSPNSVLVKLGNEKYYKEKNELILGAASYAAALECACNTEAVVVGKPCLEFFMNAIQGMGICSQEVIMVGDDIENDIHAAQSSYIRAIMVRTGKYRPDDAKNENIKPDAIVKNLEHLVDMLVLKSNRESSIKNPQDIEQNYVQEYAKQVDRTQKPMEQVSVSIPVPVSVPVPTQIHCDLYPFRFGPSNNQHLILNSKF